MAINLRAWRQQRQSTLALTCGLTITVRKVQLLDLAARGQVPAPLHSQVEALMSRSQGRAPSALGIAEFPQHAQVIDLVVRAAVLDPPITDEPSPDTLSIDELPFTDRLAIFNWAQEEAAQVATFPGAAGDGPRPARRGDSLPPASE